MTFSHELHPRLFRIGDDSKITGVTMVKRDRDNYETPGSNIIKEVVKKGRVIKTGSMFEFTEAQSTGLSQKRSRVP
jgi:glutamine amidotransferase-like uncharacterized protein